MVTDQPVSFLFVISSKTTAGKNAVQSERNKTLPQITRIITNCLKKSVQISEIRGKKRLWISYFLVAVARNLFQSGDRFLLADARRNDGSDQLHNIRRKK
jgi:hypothetical protein